MSEQSNRHPDPLGEAAEPSADVGVESSRAAAVPPAPAEPRGSATPPRPRGGRLLATLALLVALGALAGAGWLYYELIHQRDVRAVTGELETLRAELGEAEQRFAALAERQQAALEAFRERQEQARAATERALRESLSEVARQAPPSTAEWRRAEAQYLLRIANHRLLMERDVEGALRLLRAADAVITDLDDFALHDVRARLADEIAALESVTGTDVQGIFLRLEAVKGNLDELPLRLPEYLQREPPPPAEPAADDFWSALKRQLAGMVSWRRLDAEVKPLLAPEEAVYLELNLRLQLERAQLAAVRREQMIFEESLATALEWIERYLDTRRRPVQRMLSELEELRQVDLERPLPDISGSLNALQAASRNPP
ncbi:MAG TPA: uroporphyrinogen-III C-methyltransferase [Pseudomonadales bacterium]